MTTLGLALSLWAAVAAAPRAADDHMHAGARYFQAARFDEALVEFRVAESWATRARPGTPPPRWSSSIGRPTLSSSSRERRGWRPRIATRSSTTTHAVACSEVRLYACADRLLAGIDRQAGPRVAAQAETLRATLRPLLAGPPPAATVDCYHARRTRRSSPAAGRSPPRTSKRRDAGPVAAPTTTAATRRRRACGTVRPRLPLAGRRMSTKP